MGKKKNRNQKRRIMAPASQRRLPVPALLIAAFLAIVGAGGWLVANEPGPETIVPAEAATAQALQTRLSQPAFQELLQKLVGRWRRPDGGYLLEVLAAQSDGTLSVSYHNPRPIHVSQARVTLEKDTLQIFIELNDTGYPGATYTLRFHSRQDVLAGVYYQPAVGQTFKVVFVRENS